MENYIPDIYQKSIYMINYDKLLENGIKCLLIDLDNTIVSANIKEPNQKNIELFCHLKELGFRVILFSNASRGRLKPFKEKLEVDCCAHACKPMRSKFVKILQAYEYQVSEVAIIGDQLLTDILGGNKVGITTILVNPVSTYDPIWTKVGRMKERRIMKKLRAHDLFAKGKYYD